MGFDAARFDKADMKPRTARVPVPALSMFFSRDESETEAAPEQDGKPAEWVPHWEVRGLNGNELNRAWEAGKRQNSMESMLKALAANADQTKLLRQAIGLTGDVPGEMAKRLELLVIGSVSPKIELPTAVKLAERFPIEFMQLTNEITQLTGQGYDFVKPSAASQTTTA